MLIVWTDITPKNVLLQLKGMDTWPTETIYQQLGHPIRHQVFTFSGQRPDLSAPEYLVESASFSSVDFKYISEQALLIDLGEAFPELSPPSNGVGTPVSYCSPELLMESKAGRASDIWALACTIFEIRSGFPLFESFVGSAVEILEEMLRILGRPPEPCHSRWEQYRITIADHAPSSQSTLSHRVREIGMYDQEASFRNSDVASEDHHTLLEPSRNRISRDEEIELVDLLRRALDHTPDKRLSAERVANHPWFTQDG